nr:hypothetical protein [Klebsiella pneumoniae]
MAGLTEEQAFTPGPHDMMQVPELREFRRIALPPEPVAQAIAYAIEQPAGVDISELIVRPVASPH